MIQLTESTVQLYTNLGVTQIIHIIDRADLSRFNIEVTEEEVFYDIYDKYDKNPSYAIHGVTWITDKEKYDETIEWRKRNSVINKINELRFYEQSAREMFINNLSESSAKDILKLIVSDQLKEEEQPNLMSSEDKESLVRAFIEGKQILVWKQGEEAPVTSLYKASCSFQQFLEYIVNAKWHTDFSIED